MNCILRIEPRDPMVARDGRPFGIGQGYRMKSLPWPYPSTTSGAIRTIVGKLDGGVFNSEMISDLNQIAIYGPLPVSKSAVCLPAPQDIAVDPQAHSYKARPTKVTPEWNLSVPGLWPVQLPDNAPEFKPAKLKPFWPWSLAELWLTEDLSFTLDKPQSRAVNVVERQERTHVEMEPDTGSAREGRLFTTAGLEFHEDCAMTVRVICPDRFAKHLTGLDVLHPVGGERRIAHVCAANNNWWECPPTIKRALHKKPRIRMQLATPAIFSDGWLPGWLGRGKPDDAKHLNIQLTLRGIAMGRWRAISGWDLEKRRPKPIRRLVPAGSVYFFDVEGDADQLAEVTWLRPVSDNDQDCRDGFGLAVWGTW